MFCNVIHFIILFHKCFWIEVLPNKFILTFHFAYVRFYLIMIFDAVSIRDVHTFRSNIAKVHNIGKALAKIKCGRIILQD